MRILWPRFESHNHKSRLITKAISRGLLRGLVFSKSFLSSQICRAILISVDRNMPQNKARFYTCGHMSGLRTYHSSKAAYIVSIPLFFDNIRLNPHYLPSSLTFIPFQPRPSRHTAPSHTWIRTPPRSIAKRVGVLKIISFLTNLPIFIVPFWFRWIEICLETRLDFTHAGTCLVFVPITLLSQPTLSRSLFP